MYEMALAEIMVMENLSEDKDGAMKEDGDEAVLCSMSNHKLNMRFHSHKVRERRLNEPGEHGHFAPSVLCRRGDKIHKQG